MKKKALITELITRLESSKVILKDLESDIEFEIEEVKTNPDNTDEIIIGFCQ